jgi:hypothetical protein
VKKADETKDLTASIGWLASLALLEEGADIAANELALALKQQTEWVKVMLGSLKH